MNRIVLALAALLLAATGLTLVATPANAHTPTITADCNGVVLKATSYDGSKANTWEVTVAGVKQSGTFGATFDKTVAVPQDGKTTSWSARIKAYDGQYDTGLQTGTVGPCGTHDECPTIPGDQPTGYDCSPTPPREVHGKVVKVDKCGVTADRYKVRNLPGAEYVVGGKAIREGVWLKGRGRVNIYLHSTSPKVKVVGTRHWHLLFKSNACPTPPTNPPHTGARTVA